MTKLAIPGILGSALAATAVATSSFAAEAQHEWMRNMIEGTIQEWSVDQVVIESEIWDVSKSASDAAWNRNFGSSATDFLSSAAAPSTFPWRPRTDARA